MTDPSIVMEQPGQQQLPHQHQLSPARPAFRSDGAIEEGQEEGDGDVGLSMEVCACVPVHLRVYCMCCHPIYDFQLFWV